MEIADAQALWSPAGPYLNTATFGLPPRTAWDELQAVLEDWRHGRTSWEHWTESTERARAAFGRLVGVAAEDVACGGTTSQHVSIVATSLPDGSRVLVPEDDFTSLVYPFLTQADRGVTVDVAPLDRLADAVTKDHDVVAASLVQSSTGQVLALDAVLDAASSADAIVVLDATQACGWLPVDGSRVDVLAAHAYKWMCSPRGTAFCAIRPEVRERLRPSAANWFSTVDPFGTYYGTELRLAHDARRFDTSPAWFSWTGTAPTLELLADIGVEKIHEHDVGLANRFRAGLGLAPGDSAIVSTDVPGAEEKLERAGIRAAVRDGRVRASFHVYTTEADVDAALDALQD